MLVQLRFLIITSILFKLCDSIAHFLSSDELRYTFGVRSSKEVFVYILNHSVPSYNEIVPEAVYSKSGSLRTLNIEINGIRKILAFEPSTPTLVSPHLITIYRRSNDDNRLYIGQRNHCHYHHKSNDTFAAVSICDGHIKGLLILPEGVFVIHPYPDRYALRFKRDEDSHGLHIIYKRDVVENDFCGIESLLSADELANDDNEINEDIFVIGQRFTEESELIVELAIFVDELLWKHFSSKYGGQANQKLEDYALTMLNNIQIMYQQPTAVPPLTFRVVRFEVLITQPVALAAHLHNSGHAQKYLDKFCRYQRSLGNRDWDHAILLTGYDIHRGSGSRAISGIARLDGMCDPWNTCTLAEGLDFTSAFISTHEIGHSLGMRHDEPYCASKHIMSSSLGPGKVTWSTCSMRDYHAFLQRLDLRGRNCLRVSNLPQKLTMRTDVKPGQVYSADEQCRMMHGNGYRQITPRQDHYDGICHMMWCGTTSFGRIVTSHPALEGTFCATSKWCELGRCVPWPGKGPGPKPSISPKKVDGQWSDWSATSCNQCSCSNLIGSIGIAINTRSCSSPAPANGGHECVGANTRGIVCQRKCLSQKSTVDQFISEKCSEHKKLRSDRELTGLGSQLNRYPQRACKVFCDVSSAYGSQRNYRFFGDNLPNGAPCGGGKYCLNGECLTLSCNGNALLSRDLSCPTDKCPLKSSSYRSGDWSVWSSWSFCSQTCGSGFRTRTRTCSGHSCEGSATDNGSCDLPPCIKQSRDRSSYWSEWTVWNQCSVTCGQGSQARYRRCISSDSRSNNCAGKAMETRNCDMGTCYNGITGLWGAWTEWSQCTATCGPGIRTRNRYCTKEPCDGSGQSRMSCNLRACETWTQKWSEWSTWSQCSQMCEKGFRTRTRSCSGAGCIGSSTDQQFCNEHPCVAASGQWSGWSVWSTCSATCGTGVKRRTRHCQYGNCPGSHKESTNCYQTSCEQTNATWGGWGYWSTCSETCGRGIRKRVRKCYGLLNNFSPKCVGNEYEREFCNLRTC